MQAHEVIQPLYGHVSPETAYVVNDYPYGFKLRCKIRYWIEFKAGKGFRFVSQTTNPKLDFERWNKPKASTYVELGMCLYLDAVGHVQHGAVSAYSKAESLQTFVQCFPGADLSSVRSYVRMRCVLLNKYLDGSRKLPCDRAPEEFERIGYVQELAILGDLVASAAAQVAA
jgi:hypothetical protein